jgi:hypothetical protein
MILGIGALGVGTLLYLLAGMAAEEKPGPKTGKQWGGLLFLVAVTTAVCAVAVAIYRSGS